MKTHHLTVQASEAHSKKEYQRAIKRLINSSVEGPENTEQQNNIPITPNDSYEELMEKEIFNQEMSERVSQEKRGFKEYVTDFRAKVMEYP